MSPVQPPVNKSIDTEIPTPEIVPRWLLRLLRKYGEEDAAQESERMRPLPPSRPASDFSHAQTAVPGLTGVLEDLAGSAPSASDRLATSVEWGEPAPAPPPASSAAMDNLLASFFDSAPSSAPEPVDNEAYYPEEQLPVEPTPQMPVFRGPDTEAVQSWVNKFDALDETSLPVEPEPDWASGFKAASPAADEEQANIPDWLVEFADIGLPAPEDEPAPPPPAPVEPASFTQDTDWLDNLAITPPAAGRSPAVAMPAEDEDWLAGLGLPASSTSPATPPPPGDDWLTNIAASAASAPRPAPQMPPAWAEKETPVEESAWDADWLAEVAALYPADPTAEAETPSLPSTEPPALAFDQPAPVSSTPALDMSPDWLAETPDTDTLSVPEELSFGPASLPDWLSNLDAETAEEPGPVAPAIPSAQTQPDTALYPANDAVLFDAADWQTPSSEPVLPVTEQPAFELDVPDWMQNLPDIAPEPPSSPAPITPVARGDAPAKPAKEDIPDWLAELRAGKTGVEIDAETLVGKEPFALPEKDAPLGWLAGLGNDETGEAVEAESESPGWLAELQADSEAETDTLDREAELGIAQVEAHFSSSLPEDEDVPGWLAELRAGKTGVEIDAETLVGESPFALPEKGQAPGWLADFAEEDAEPEEEAGEVPDWLAGLRFEPGEETVAAEPEPVEAMLEAEPEEEAGEVPDWLAGLRFEPGEEAVAEPEPVEAMLDLELEEEKGVPDWLAELRSETEPEVVVDQPAGEVDLEETNVSNWLAGLRFEPGEETVAVEPEPVEAMLEPEPEEAVELPDWMRVSDDYDLAEPVAAELPSVEEEKPEPEEAGEVPDWMRVSDDYDLAEPVAAELPSVEEEKPEPEEEASEVPDWLAGLRFEPGEETVAVEPEPVEAMLEPEPEEAVELPDWMRVSDDYDLAEPVAAELPSVEEEKPEPEEAGEVPDWLADLRFEAEPEEVVDQPAGEIEPEEAGEVLDWLADLRFEPGEETVAVEPEPVEAMLEPEPEEEASEVPDWLAGLRFEPGEETVAVEPEPVEAMLEPEPEEALELPDWMRVSDDYDLAEPVTSELPSVEEEKPEPVEEAGEVPDWLADLRFEAEPEEVVDQPAGEIEPEEAGEVPDWLAGLRFEPGEETVAVEPEPVEAMLEPEPEEAVELPDWMRVSDDYDLAEPVTSELPSVEEEKPEPVEAVELPDWMRVSDDYDLAEPVTSELPSVEEEKPEPVEAVELPDWMLALRETAPAPAEQPPTGLELPDWMQNPDESALEEAAPVKEPDLPDWMLDLSLEEPEGFSPEEISVTAEPDQPLILSDLAEPSLAELAPPIDQPTAFSELMRDFDTPPPDLVEEETPATLPSADVAAELLAGGLVAGSLGMPSAEQAAVGEEAAREFYGIVNAVPETTFLAEEAKPKSFAGKLLRAVLNLGLLILIAIPLFIHYDRGGYPFPWLEPSPIEQAKVLDEWQYVVGAQPPGAVALVSFDYTPAYQGEMDPLAQAVVDKLLGQGMQVIAVSLEPEGQAMASAVLKEVAPDDYGSKVINLGYLPGGPIAIRNLAAGRPLAGARDIEQGLGLYPDLPGWPALNRLEDINLIVPIAANQDSARWWIEQTGPDLIYPMRLAVVSAAVEPFARPYRDANQYQGLISGINGAAALESARPQPTLGPASAMLDSQSVAHLLIMILMLFGTIAGLIAKYGQEESN